MQQHGGRLPLEVARVTLAGLGPQLPLPRMRGMQQFGGASYSPQVTGSSVPGPAMPGYAPQATGAASVSVAGAAFAAAGYTPQMTGAAGLPGTAGAYAPQFTGAGYMPQMTGALLSTCPPCSQNLM